MRLSPAATFAPVPAEAPSLWARIVARIDLWATRAQERDALAALSERELIDMGLTREDADEEAAKPFWRA